MIKEYDMMLNGFKKPNLRAISFASPRRGRIIHTHTTNHFTKFPFFNKQKKSNLTYAIADNGKKIRCGSSVIEDKWLDKLNVRLRQKVIILAGKTYIVDGFDPKTMTCFEMLGDYYHGSHKVFPTNRNLISKHLGKSPNELYNGTIARFKILKSHSFKIYFVWESDFKKGQLGRLYRGGNDNLY